MEHTPWADFYEMWIDQDDDGPGFLQGDHVCVIGPTKSGKTSLVTELIKPRSHVVALGVKKRDDVFAELQKQGWKRIQSWGDRGSHRRLLLWPDSKTMHDAMKVRRATFHEMFENVWAVGGRTIWIDELRNVSDPKFLGLGSDVILQMVEGRTNHVTIVSSTQRPAWVPPEVYGQCKHLILFKTNDFRDLMRVGSLNGADPKEVVHLVGGLPHHSFLHINLHSGEKTISNMRKG